ncbi:MAG: hypothetical protein R3E90_08970 [Marinicella sp.]|nr:hypothetical protein [Xanthomonadales bacterium]
MNTKNINVQSIFLIVIICTIASPALPLSYERATLSEIVAHNEYLVKGVITKVENFPQLCENIGVTKYSIQIQASSTDKLNYKELDFIVFGGESRKGGIVYSNKNYLLKMNQEVMVFLNSEKANKYFVSNLNFGILAAKNDKVSIPWVGTNNNHQMDVIDLIDEFSNMRNQAKLEKLKTSISKYYEKAWKGDITCENKQIQIKSIETISNLNKPILNYTNPNKFSLIYPGRTHRKTITGPASGTGLFYLLSESAFNSWNRYGENDFLINVIGGNNTWSWGGLVPKNEFGGFPSDADLGSLGLPPWDANTLGITFHHAWGETFEADIALNPNKKWTYRDWDSAVRGFSLNYLYNTMGHELGHFLNLDHPFENYDVIHHSIMNYAPSSCRRGVLGIDDLRAFSGITSAISPPLNLNQYEYSVYPCATSDQNGLEAAYTSLSFYPRIFDCNVVDCYNENSSFSAEVSGFTVQNFGMEPQTEPLNIGFMFKPNSRFGRYIGEPYNNNTYATIPIPSIPSLGSYIVDYQNPISIDFKIPAHVGYNPFAWYDNSISFSGGLLWPFFSRYSDENLNQGFSNDIWLNKGKPSPGSIFIKGKIHSFLNDPNYSVNFEDTSSSLIIPLGGALLFNAVPNVGGMNYLKISAPENAEIHVREYRLDLGRFSREFRLCGGTNFNVARIQIDPVNASNHSRFLIYFKYYDEVYFDPNINSAEPYGPTNNLVVRLRYYSGDGSPFENYYQPIGTLYDTIFSNNFEQVELNNGLNCNMEYETVNTFSVYNLGMPFDEFPEITND